MKDPASETLETTARRLPKVLLHEHLDGGLRVATLLQLLQQRGLQAPAADEDSLAAWFDARAHAGSLVEYLRGFALTIAAMATPAALQRVAFEAAEDARLDGCVLAEFRIAPLLFEPHGVSGEVAIEAMLAGLLRSPLPSGLIICGMRQHDAAEIRRSAELALRYHGQGVVGFDLAGPEYGFPATPHAALLAQLTDQGLPLTLHAGEADSAERVIEAGRLGARRIGHGVRLAEVIGTPMGDAMLAEVHALGLHLEVCPTSNVHTGAAMSVATHPIRALWDAGVSLSFHTDNRLISCIHHSSEAAALVREAAFSWDDLKRMGLAAADASFLPAAERATARAAIEAWSSPA
ncbi:adenosine deaminase family protein [Aquincola sp. S2]|uniref:adenosine deaminase n=1 Tax=Pseudaquabacterium terrae TaxID=2732868 RepID=A0ABX2EKR5_9BURK|nr:adenosine deaminase family protein [Aquabacterium terrae]NRF69228.1 adenosine deaminase family protein [Aquabacterium terrae]